MNSDSLEKLSLDKRRSKFEFLSEALDAGTNMESTAFYPLFAQILAENPQLTAEENVLGEKTDYWYKIRKASETTAENEEDHADEGGSCI